MTKKQTYQQEKEKQLEEIDTRLRSLEASLEQMESQAKIEYQRQLKTLQLQRQELAAKIASLKDSSEQAWTDLKLGIELALNDLTQGISEALG